MTPIYSRNGSKTSKRWHIGSSPCASNYTTCSLMSSRPLGNGIISSTRLACSRTSLIFCFSFLLLPGVLNAEYFNRFTGLNAEQCKALVEKAHIYLTGNGRISMAGLNSCNIRYFAESVDKAVRGTL